MRRREFIRLAGSGLLWPLGARAAETKRVGVLMNGVTDNTVAQGYARLFVGELSELGWNARQNLQIDIRWNAGDPALARTYAKDLVGLHPDVILSSSTTNLIALRGIARGVPIVFVEVADPVAQGFVASMEHPGGDITGFTAFRTAMAGQWLDLLKEIAPRIERVLVIFNPETSPQSKVFLNAIDSAAPSLGVDAYRRRSGTRPRSSRPSSTFRTGPTAASLFRATRLPKCAAAYSLSSRPATPCPRSIPLPILCEMAA